MGLSPSQPRRRQDVKSTNHPPYCRNKLKFAMCGNPVKMTLDKMKGAAEDITTQEQGCETLAKLAQGPYYNGLVGKYDGLEHVITVVNKFNKDQLCMFAAVKALTIFAENGPNAAKLREMKAEKTIRELKKLYKRDTFMALDIDQFFEVLQETGIKLAAEYVEDAVIEEDCPTILQLCATYIDLVEVVEGGVKQIERLLKTEDHVVEQMKESADLPLIVTLITACRTNHMVVYRCLSIMHILTDDDAMSLELGKAGAVRLCIDLVREKKSGKHAELLQVSLFLLCRLVQVESNAIIFHKLMGTMATEAIEERIKNDKYDYPIVLPLRLKRVMDQRDEILRRDDEARLAKDPERQDRDQERKMYEDESLIQAVVLRREAHVIQGKKAQLAWEFKGVDFDPLANKKEEDPDAWKTWKKKKEVDTGPIVVGFIPPPEDPKPRRWSVTGPGAGAGAGAGAAAGGGTTTGAGTGLSSAGHRGMLDAILQHAQDSDSGSSGSGSDDDTDDGSDSEDDSQASAGASGRRR